MNNFNKKLNSEQNSTLLNIFTSSYLLYEKLFKIKQQYGVEFEFGIAGGCLRDIFANKVNAIKDIDFYISPINVYGTNTQNKFLNHSLHSQKVIKLLEQLIKDNPTLLSTSEALHHLVKESFSDLNLTKEFPPKDIESENVRMNEFENQNVNQRQVNKNNMNNVIYIEESSSNSNELYIRNNVLSVIKYEPIEFSYPIDVILLGSSIFEFVNNFDFNICKILSSFCTIQDEKLSKDEFINIMFENITPLYGFWEDMNEQTLTLSLNYGAYQLKKSLYEHYPRIKKKYPDHKIVFFEEEKMIHKLSPNEQKMLLDFQIEDELNLNVNYLKKPKKIKM